MGLAAATDASAANFIVSYTPELETVYQSAGQQTSSWQAPVSGTLQSGGTEDFSVYTTYDNTPGSVNFGKDVATVLNTGDNQTFTTDFNTLGKITGTYKGVDIVSADQYGAAGGAGQFADAKGATSTSSYTLQLNTPANYFGYWLSALDKGNIAQFYGTVNGQADQLLFTLSPQEVITAVGTKTGTNPYYGNPNTAFLHQDSNEPFVFLNFYDLSGNFDKVVFSEQNNGGAGYESDNHTVGFYATDPTTGAPVIQGITVPNAGGAPEPSGWALLLCGVGLTGAGLRRRRTSRTSPASS
jgi:hypothetical protein